MKRNTTKAAMAVLATLSLGGCSPEQSYVKADRMTYEVVRPDHLKRLMDDGVQGAELARWVRLYDAWQIRLIAAEGR